MGNVARQSLMLFLLCVVPRVLPAEDFSLLPSALATTFMLGSNLSDLNADSMVAVRGNTVTRMTNGDWLVAGMERGIGVDLPFDKPSLCRPFAARISAQGRMIWRTYLGDWTRSVQQDQDHRTGWAFEDQSGAFFLAGSMLDFRYSHFVNWIARLDANGILLWSKDFETDKGFLIDSACLTDNGNLVVSFNGSKSAPSTMDDPTEVLWFVNAKGDVVDRAVFDAGDQGGHYRAASLTRDGDGALLLLGDSTDRSIADASPVMHLARFSPVGVALWSIGLEFPQGHDGNIVIRPAGLLVEGGSYVAYASVKGSNYSGLLFARIDKSGSLLQQKALFTSEAGFDFERLRKTDQGYEEIVSLVGAREAAPTFAMLQLDKDFNLLHVLESDGGLACVTLAVFPDDASTTVFSNILANKVPVAVLASTVEVSRMREGRMTFSESDDLGERNQALRLYDAARFSIQLWQMHLTTGFDNALGTYPPAPRNDLPLPLQWLAGHSSHPPDTQILAATTIRSGVPLHVTPSEQSQIITTLDQGTIVHVLDVGSIPTAAGGLLGRWYKVLITNGTSGWIHGPSLEIEYEVKQ